MASDLLILGSAIEALGVWFLAADSTTSVLDASASARQASEALTEIRALRKDGAPLGQGKNSPEARAIRAAGHKTSEGIEEGTNEAVRNIGRGRNLLILGLALALTGGLLTISS